MTVLEFLTRPEWEWTGNRQDAGQAVPRDALSMLVYRNLSTRLPVLYLALAIISIAAALVARGHLLSAFYFGFPGLLFIASVVRFFVWRKRRGVEPDPSDARAALTTTLSLTVILITATSIWTVSGFFETDGASRILPPIFMALGAMASATCLASLPRAAIAALVIGIGPISAVMMLSGEPQLIGTGASLATVAMLQARLVLTQFAAISSNLALRSCLEQQAESDPLTGLCNRRAFDRELAAAIAIKRPFVLAVLDLDRFKPVNDTLGHAAGDELLRAVGRRLVANCRYDDLVARLGGDEFAIILRSPPSGAMIPSWTNRFEELLSAPYRLSQGEVRISASIGTAAAGQDGLRPDELVETADIALYRAKEAKRRGVPRTTDRARRSQGAAGTTTARSA